MGAAAPLGTAEFAGLLAGLGPFEPSPRLAAGVSGGADSLCLALLADRWARAQGGALLALIVDHGLRPGSAAEADATARSLAERNIPGLVLPLRDLGHGAALAERARAARYRALADACARAGIVHLLLGHHRADQAETVLIRTLGGSGPVGMAAMARLTETAGPRLLRPLLHVPPARLRATLSAAGMGWIEDPSNADPRALRPRLRLLRADRDGTGAATAALDAAATAAARARGERAVAADAWLGAHVVLRPEGFAVLPPGPFPADAFATLVQALSASPYPPRTDGLATLARAPRPASIAGLRLIRSGRHGPGFILLREEAAIGPAVPVRDGAVWDGRFRISLIPPPGSRKGALGDAMLGALGDDAAKLRARSPLPSAVLRTLPAVRLDGLLVAVPHLDYYRAQGADDEGVTGIRLILAPPRAASGAALPETRCDAAGELIGLV